MRQTAHRSSKHERQEALKVLKGIWVKGYEEGVTLCYEIGEEAECGKVFFSLAEFRRRINKKKLEEYELFLKIQSTMLQRIDDRTIKLTRKPKQQTETAQAILNTVVKFPELGLAKKEYDNPVHDILAGMRSE